MLKEAPFFAVAKTKTEKFRLTRIPDPCDTGTAILPSELASELGGGHHFVEKF